MSFNRIWVALAVAGFVLSVAAHAEREDRRSSPQEKMTSEEKDALRREQRRMHRTQMRANKVRGERRPKAEIGKDAEKSEPSSEAPSATE